LKFNPLHQEGLIKLLTKALFSALAMTITDIDIGICLVELTIQKEHLSPYGAIQGGVYSSIIDTAAYWAPYAELDPDAGLISMDVTVHNLASVKGGRLLARGDRIKIGRTTCLAEATITDENGRIVAHGSSKLLVTRGLQTIPQMTGYSADKVPVKFI
jgi:uncharacterized protein (TIGR00369 family)